MKRQILLAAVFVSLACVTANATSVTSTTFASWKTNLTGSPTEADFSPIQYTSYNTSSGITLNAIGNSSIQFAFTGPDGTNTWSLTGATYNTYKSLEGGSNSAATVHIALPGSGENAILLGLGSTGSTADTITLSDGETFTTSASIWGVSISHDVTWLTVATSSGSQVAISDFWYGASSLTQDGGGSGGSGGGTAAPEPLAALLLSGGLLILIGAHRRFLNGDGDND